MIPDAEITAAYPELRPLIDLRSAGWRLTPVTSDGVVTRVDGMRVWPDPDHPHVDWVDVVVVLSSTDAQALRANPDGDTVWAQEGTLTDVVDGLLSVPPPGTPGAPRLVQARGPRLWTP